MNIQELDYHLPEHLIAQQGLADRSASRLLVLHRDSGLIEHRRFIDVVDYLRPADCLVINDTKVIPARFFVRRATGGRIEGLFLQPTPEGHWQVLLKNAARLRPNEIVTLVSPTDTVIASPPTLTVHSRQPQGRWLLQPDFPDHYLDILQCFGSTPLPPYIHRRAGNAATHADRERYQTVYAAAAGSVAAPTAGLHFTPALLDQLHRQGVSIARLTLHVGLGTFKPITADTLEAHVMHAEPYLLTPENAALINQALDRSARVVAVGTTSVRTLETLAQNRRVRPGAGSTDLFITPGFQFNVVGAMLTNFHLPRTTLLALVCSFAGTMPVLAAYRQAIEREYRFYSYGDAMLIL